MCVNLFHRDSHIIQVQYSDRLASNLEDACLSPNMDVMDSELVTMIKGEKLLHKPCPELGRWGSNKTEPIEHLSVGCDSVASSIMLTEVASIETGNWDIEFFLTMITVVFYLIVTPKNLFSGLKILSQVLEP